MSQKLLDSTLTNRVINLCVSSRSGVTTIRPAGLVSCHPSLQGGDPAVPVSGLLVP
jgi:hypothetical protein